MNVLSRTSSAHTTSIVQMSMLMENVTTFLFLRNFIFSRLFSPGMTVFLLHTTDHILSFFRLNYDPPVFEYVVVAEGHNQGERCVEGKLDPSVCNCAWYGKINFL